MGFLRLLAGVALWPAVWGAGCAVAAVFPAAGARGSVEPVAWAGGGFILFGVLWVAGARPVRAYVLAHELAHAAAGILCGAKVGRMKVGGNGGYVQLSKSNMFITLAPYFTPLYMILAALASIAVRHAAGALPCPPAWIAAAGFLWSFHCFFTFDALLVRQPDIQEYGRVFSWTLIALANAATLALSLAAAASVPVRVPLRAGADSAFRVYGSAADAAKNIGTAARDFWYTCAKSWKRNGTGAGK